MRQTASALWADWAEPVPDAPFPMTTAEVMRLPDDDWQEEVDVWLPASLTSGAPVTVLHATDALDGLSALSGFTHPQADLFA